MKHASGQVFVQWEPVRLSDDRSGTGSHCFSTHRNWNVLMDRIWNEFETVTMNQADPFLGTGREDDEGPSSAERQDWYYRGTGPLAGPSTPQRQASPDKVEQAREWQRRRIARLQAAIAITDVTEFSAPLQARVSILASEARTSEGWDQLWLTNEINESIRLERETARLQPDEETLASILQVMKETT